MALNKDDKIKFLIDVFKGFESKKEINETDLKTARITISQVLDELEKDGELNKDKKTTTL